MITNSLIIPVYKNELNIPSLLKTIGEIHKELLGDLEVVFVVDGSPDKSYEILKKSLDKEFFLSKIVLLSKNFGSFSAIKTGLQVATGKYFSIMSADLQEPSDLIIKFFNILKKEEVDVVIGTREGRADSFSNKLASNLFWRLYKKFIITDMPKGGIDIFGCNTIFRNNLLKFKESNSSLIAQIFWLGFRRKQVYYKRLERQVGTSAWTFKKKVTYMMDSVFSFTDLPIKLLLIIGIFGIIIFGVLGLSTFIFKMMGLIHVPGYTTLFLLIGFLGGINIFGLAIIGYYVWRTFENTKNRPQSVVLSIDEFNNS